MNIDKEINNAIKHLSNNDKVMLTIIKKNGKCNLTLRKQYFHALLRAIIGQQLSVNSARAINKKFFQFFNNKPTAEKILAATDENLRSLGLSNSKMKYVQDLSSKILSKEISLRNISRLDNNSIIEKLTKVKGIGPWTAHMFLIFTLGRLDILPVGDFGIKKAIMVNYGFKNLPTEQEVVEIAKSNNWSPYEAIASWYLWRSIDQ